MLKIKFCGITNPRDAIWASNLGVDFIGLNFVNSSPRKISINQAKKIISSIPEFISSVAVFSNSEIKEVLKISKKLNTDYVQLHGEEDFEYLKKLKENNLKIIKTIKVSDETDFNNYSNLTEIVDYFLLDTKVENIEGGTGKTFNWEKAIEFKNTIRKPFFLAGGLTPLNVKEAIEKVQPFAVDVSSGIEKSPRSKDYKKMQEFVKNAL